MKDRAGLFELSVETQLGEKSRHSTCHEKNPVTPKRNELGLFDWQLHARTVRVAVLQNWIIDQ